MEFNYIESQASVNHNTFMYDTIYFQQPGEDDIEGDGDDEEDEDFDDRAADRDDLHEIQTSDDNDESDTQDYDLTNPDPDDDHLPEDDLQ